MLKWQDPLNEVIDNRLRALAEELRRIKPEKWSAILSANEIIVRPRDRALGKFSITFVRDELCAVSFFSRELNYWNKGKYFEVNDSLAMDIKSWMESESTKPLKEVREDWRKYVRED